jgi:glutathione S-transferase
LSIFNECSSPKEDLPPILTSTSEPPPLFDGTTRLYVAYHCPYAQRAWIARNYKGVQDKIKIVAIDLADRPAWYKEKVYPGNKVWLISNSVSLEQSITLFQ